MVIERLQVVLFILHIFVCVSQGEIEMLHEQRDHCDGCAFYSCLEKHAKCGAYDGYLLAYGQKYCKRFSSQEYLSRFTPIGRRFLNCTTKCLLAFLEHYFKQNQKASCADIKKSAFESHTNCYVKCDFCRVCKSDKWNLIGSYDYSDFFSWTAIKQVLSVLAHCGGPWKCFT